MTTTMNRVNGIYQRELAIRMIFVANQMNVIYTDPTTDPYSNGAISSMNSQNQTSLDSVIGSANYDIGHVVGKVTSGAGGGASLAVVCVNGSKARGATTSGNPVGDAFDVDFVAHEMGHQFGAGHTFNGSRGSCEDNGNGFLAYEPGSGSTIMAYAGICACQDLQPHSDSYFHTASVNEIINFINRPTSCAAQTATGNTPPAVDAGQNYTIPKRTAFTLSATGSDGNADSLTYSWEEFDLDFGSPPDTDEDGRPRPIFRSFPPTSNSSRTFPSSSDLQANGFTFGESLPTITRTMNFQATARDNRASGGGIATDLMQVNVNGNSGPFVVTQPNANLTWTIGTNQTIVWNVANTNAAPVNAANVRILLSTDSGLTFPNILIANTPNDGSETITIPNLPTTAARIKIEAIGNIFFDISNVDFTIAAGNCNFGLNSISQTFANVGGSGSVAVTTNPGCSWTAASFAPWITITSPNNGAGVGTVTFTVAANPDTYRTGKMSVAGQTLTITQYSHGGVLDATFAEYCGISPFGGEGFNDQLNDLLILPDGKIIAVGTTEVSSFRDFQLVRYNSNGSFDNSFGNNGIITTDFNGHADFARAILRQSDGKLVVIGNSDTASTTSVDFALVRYNSNGSLDTTFGNNGKVLTDFNNRSDTATSGAIQSDGKIIVIGNSFPYLVLARYKSDGSLDETFGTGGKVITLFSDFSSASDVALQTDGKIVLVGNGRVSVQVTDTFDFKLARYNSNGSLDTSFGTGGKVTTDFGGRNDQASSVIIKDDKIIVAGASQSPATLSNGDFALARYNSSGSLDTTFGTGGKVLTDFQGSSDTGAEVILQSDGKIIVVGTASISGTGNDFAIARYDTNGNLDATFGNGGKVTTQLPEFLTNSATSIAFQSDNKFIVGGSNGSSGSDRFFALARYESGLPLIVVQPTIKYPFDFDGDRRSDVAVFRPDNGAWYLLRSTLGFTGLQFGLNSDLIAPGDFDGDGRADISVFRPSTGSWYRLNSSNGQFAAVQFGQNGDLPRPADFDGDGKDDICVFRPSSGSWYRLNSSNGQFAAVQFGQNGDVPLIADFDGDGKSDIAVFRPSSGAWYWLNSSNGQFSAVQFGTGGDIPSVGDFDGDGKSDISVFRPANGTWYRLNSGNGQFAAAQFGLNGDIPTVGDFDGDSKSDIAVFRPSGGVWYLLQSQSGFTGVQFGIGSDKPIPSAFLP